MSAFIEKTGYLTIIEKSCIKTGMTSYMVQHKTIKFETQKEMDLYIELQTIKEKLNERT